MNINQILKEFIYFPNKGRGEGMGVENEHLRLNEGNGS